MEWDSLNELNERVVACKSCERLAEFREHVLENSKKYSDVKFWRKPLTGYGDISGRIMIIGLAPAASGGNRTGRVFTGDKSSDFLISCLKNAGLTNQETSTSKDDGLQYIDSYITLAVRCVPPENKPERSEVLNCNGFLIQELKFMKNLNTIIVLGKIAFDSLVYALKEMGVNTKGWKFGNGNFYLANEIGVFCIFHPSPRNVNTGRITREKFIELLNGAREFSLSKSLKP